MNRHDNLPDDWNSYWTKCNYHNHTYHQSEWCMYCQMEDEQEQEQELIAVELTARIMIYVMNYHGGEDCEMTKTKDAILAFSFTSENQEDKKERFHIFQSNNKFYIYLTEDDADCIDPPTDNWWRTARLSILEVESTVDDVVQSEFSKGIDQIFGGE